MGGSPPQGYPTSTIGIGDQVTGGGNNRILHIGPTGLLASTANFTYVSGTGIVVPAGEALDSASGSLVLKAAGTTAITIAATTITTALPILAPDGTEAAPSYSFSSSGESDNGMYLSASNTLGFAVAGAGNLFLSANTIEQRNGTTAQAFRVYNTYTSATNYELFAVNWTGNVCVVGTEAQTGSQRTMRFQCVQLVWNISGNEVAVIAPAYHTYTPVANSSGVQSHFVWTAPADTGMTASTESIGVNWNASATRQWATGALTLQREVLIQAPTYAFVGASTLSIATTLAVSGPPIAGANATITQPWVATFGAAEAASFAYTGSAIGVFGAGAAAVVVRDTTANSEMFFTMIGATGYFGTITAHALNLQTSNSNRLNISADGTTITSAASSVFTQSMGSGSGTAKVAALANVNNAAVGNTDAGEDNLITYALPANALSANAKGVRIRAWGTGANNANAKTLKLYFGTQVILTTSLTINQVDTWKIEATVWRTGAAGQDWETHLIQSGTTTLVDVENGTATQDETAAITIKCTGEATTTNDIVQEGLSVEFFS